MNTQKEQTCTAFKGNYCIASGSIVEVVKMVKRHIDRGEEDPIFIFDDATGEIIEMDFRGELNSLLERLEKSTSPQVSDPSDSKSEQKPQRGPGRPRLGVIGREVTLLPRHWEWLNSQPGGASVTLRKLVEEARRTYRDRDRVRYSQEVAYRFMSAMAGNLAGFEEAARSLFAGNSERFDHHTASWPEDIRAYAQRLSKAALQEQTV